MYDEECDMTSGLSAMFSTTDESGDMKTELTNTISETMEHQSAEQSLDTQEMQPQSYDKDKGLAHVFVHGYNFRYKFCALVYLRAKNMGYKFKLASNMKGVGAFDDVVVEYFDYNCRKSHIFVQLKSKINKQITMQQLLSGRGDFSLRKYYDSYIQIEEKFNCSELGLKTDGSVDESLFILYTNTEVPRDLKSNIVSNTDEAEFLMSGGSVLQFNEQEHKAIYQHLQDLPKYRKFLSRFRIFYSQADERVMDDHIKSELGQSMNVPESEMDLTSTVFLAIIQDWWQNCDYFLQDINCKQIEPLQKTAEKVRITLAAKILDQRKSELDDLSIKYKQSAITEMKQLIEPHRVVVVFAPGRSTTLTAAKIHQMLSATEHSILNLEQFRRYKTEVMLAWKNSFDVLVLESQKSTENFQDVANEISIMLNDCGVQKMFIFISGRQCNIQQLSALRGTFGTKLTEEYDDWKLTDIIIESTKFLLEKKVTFQGTETQIRHLIKESDFRMLNALDCDSISLLLANENPTIGKPTENTLNYYVDRTLESVTNFEVSNEPEIKTLVRFRKESLEELQGEGSHREENYDTSENGQGISQFPLENDDENMKSSECSEINTLRRLCIRDQRPLKRQSADECLKVQKGFQMKSSNVWRPSTLLDGEDKLILVTDDPGMGKSTLLTHLANQTRELHPGLWIVRANFNNYTRILHGIHTNGFEEKDAIKLLTEAAQVRETGSSQLEEQLFNYIYNSTGNMAVLIDGVDEVSPHYTEEVIKIVRILSKTKVRKIWITSRNSVRDQLEREFQCQSYSLTPFSVEYQKSFLVKFWKQKFLHISAENLESLAHRVIELSSHHPSLREKNFLGIPLQSMLLAEMFEETLKMCSASMTTVELPENLNILILYHSYLEKKWNIYLSEKKLSDRTNVNALTDDDALYDIFIDNHKAAALMATLSPQQLEKLNDKSVLKKGVEFLQKIEQGLEKTGIITNIIEGRPVFLHRTFDKYLMASWLCDNTFDSQIFMRDHLFESGFDAVRSMVDGILADNCPLHQAVLNSNIRHVAKLLKRKESITQKDGGGRTPLHVAVSCRSQEIIRLLLEHGADVSSVDTLLGLSPVNYASRMVDWQILSLMMEKRPGIREQVLCEMNLGCTEYITSALRAAAKNGHTDMLRCLIGRENCVNMALPGDSSTLLHEAARGNHIQTVRTLVDLGASCDFQDADGKTALHVAAETGSLEVAKFIVELQETCYGEDELKYFVTLDRATTKLEKLNFHDKDGNTPLHLAAAAGNTTTVRYLLSAGSDVRSCNTRGEYPLTLAARYDRSETVKLLMQVCSDEKVEEILSRALNAAVQAGHVETAAFLITSGAPVNGGENEEPLHIASRMGHQEMTNLLLKNGASLMSRNDSGNTALHLASEAGHLRLVKYFVELQRDGLCSLNYDNETPLHLAAENGRDYLVAYFAEKGCNINAACAGGDTCLHVACENGHYTTVECLLKYGAVVNAMNSANQTPLHIAACRGQTKIVELLFQHNANISLRDKDGITALLAASINGYHDTVLFIVQHGGNIEDTDRNGNTIAHFAVADKNNDVLNFLSENHAHSLHIKNFDGETPLLQALREDSNCISQYVTEGPEGNRTAPNDAIAVDVTDCTLR